MQLLKSNYKNYDMLDKETTFNMNTASLHKINRESQKKGKLLQYISFINRITFVNHDNRYFLKYIETLTCIRVQVLI